MLGRLDGWMGAACLAALTCLMLGEVLVRALSDIFPWVPADIPVAWEYSSYLMAAAFTFGAAMTLRAGGHIRVTLVLARVTPATRRWMETVLAALGVAFTGFLALAMVNFTWRSFSSGQISISSDTPRLDAAGAGHLRHLPAGPAVRGALLPGPVRPAARGPQHARGIGRRMIAGDSGRLTMLEIVIVMFVVLFAFLAGGLWIGWTLAVTGTVLLAIFRDIPLDKLLAQYAWNILTTQELLALPLFIVMGEILFRTRLSQSLFRGLTPWAALLPGRLLHVNVIGCSIFAAISGSSAATTQVVGRISLAELLKRGYSKDVAVGSLAGAGTLGFLIPPSNIMIIYGVLGDVSIAKLFTAGFIPGFLLAAMLHGLDHDP